MNRFFAVAMIFMCVSLPSWGETRSYEGTVTLGSDVVRIPLVLETPLRQVSIWTDSYQDGVHFDPVVVLWLDGTLVNLSDDNPGIRPGQTMYDSGLYFDRLAAGNYLLTLTRYPNFPLGQLLDNGFRYDLPDIPVVPINNCPSPTNCPGGYYHLQVEDGVPLPSVPEPQAWQLLLGGLLLVLGLGRYNDGLVSKPIRHLRHAFHHRIPQQLRPA